jgi:polysaccharide deacetylase family protein (PEP-CTERM system associated)
MNFKILLTVDVEDWFQVENFKPWIPFSTWPERELRVEKSTHRLLNLLDSITLNNSTNPNSSSNPVFPKATFFILGWIAERLPHLVKEIHERGHEIASHGFNHNLCNQQTGKELEEDLIRSKKLLEDIIGATVIGYRAPSFSISDEALRIIEDCGYLYDSSFNSFDMHDRYGQVDFSDHNKQGIAYKISDDFFEIPISNLKLKTKNLELPWGGGGYFRLLPFSIFKMGIRSILKKESAYVFYLHPWEIDPEQPRVNGVSTFFKFRHYINLKKTYSKLSALIEEFNHGCFITCSQYLANNKQQTTDNLPNESE